MYRELIIFSTLLVVAFCITCDDDQFNLDEVRCCSKCPSGFGVISDCRYDNDTICAPCKKHTFSSKASHTERCRQCTVCGDNAKLIAECNEERDTICECDVGLYFNLTTRKCQPCTVCDVGFGVSRQCSKNQDTRCTPCVNGTTYSDEPSPSLECLQCSTCKEEAVTLKACTTTEDSICFSMDPTYLSGKPTKPDLEDEESSNTGAELIPLYCAIMGLIVAALLAYVVYKQWKIRGKKRRQQYLEAEKGYAVAGKKGSDSGVYMDENRHANNKKYTDLSASKRKEAEAAIMAGEPDSWQKVARQLGCPRERISALETQQETQNDSKLSPITSLLTDWARQEGSTVGALVKALRHTGRHDVVRLLQSESRNSPQPV